MPTTLEWKDIAVRLAWTVVAGALIGFGATVVPGRKNSELGMETAALIRLRYESRLFNGSKVAHGFFQVRIHGVR
jgi:hypothetical protein